MATLSKRTGLSQQNAMATFLLFFYNHVAQKPLKLNKWNQRGDKWTEVGDDKRREWGMGALPAPRPKWLFVLWKGTLWACRLGSLLMELSLDWAAKMPTSFSYQDTHFGFIMMGISWVLGVRLIMLHETSDHVTVCVWTWVYLKWLHETSRKFMYNWSAGPRWLPQPVNQRDTHREL